MIAVVLKERNFQNGSVVNKLEAGIWSLIAERWARGLTTEIVWLTRNDANMKSANRLARTAAQRDGRAFDEVMETYLYRCKKLRRSDKFARLMEEWQAVWSNEQKGRVLYEHCPEVEIQRIATSFRANQFLTGHGNLLGYLKRFNLRDTDGQCSCGNGVEDIGHVKIRCDLDNRTRTRNTIRRVYGDLELRLRRNRLVQPDQLAKAEMWAKGVLDTEDRWLPEEDDSE